MPESNNFIAQLSADYPQFKFRNGASDHWSPKTNTVIYRADQPLKSLKYSLLHELAHAMLKHVSYNSDFELLKLEAQAWDLAASIGKKYKVEIDMDHIQNCLDSYRDWLHKRSECPTCGTHVLQKNSWQYQCYNCLTVWNVTSGRFVRPYRRKTTV